MQRQHNLFRGRKWLVTAVSCLFLVGGLAACGGGGGGTTGTTPEMDITPPPTGDDHPDTIAGAVAIMDGETVDGSLDSPDDEDFFRLDLPEGASVIDVTLQAEAGVEVALLDSEGSVLGVAETVSQVESAGPVAPAAASPVPDVGPLLAIGLRVVVQQGGRYVIRLATTPGGRATVKKAFKLTAQAQAAASVTGTVVNLVRGIPNGTVYIGPATLDIDLRQHFEVDGVPSPDFDFKVALNVGVPKSFRRITPAGLRTLGFTVQLDNHIMKIGADSGATDGRGINFGVSASYDIPGTEGVISAATGYFTVTPRAREGNGGLGPSLSNISRACIYEGELCYEFTPSASASLVSSLCIEGSSRPQVPVSSCRRTRTELIPSNAIIATLCVLDDHAYSYYLQEYYAARVDNFRIQCETEGGRFSYSRLYVADRDPRPAALSFAEINRRRDKRMDPE